MGKKIWMFLTLHSWKILSSAKILGKCTKGNQDEVTGNKSIKGCENKWMKNTSLQLMI